MGAYIMAVSIQQPNIIYQNLANTYREPFRQIKHSLKLPTIRYSSLCWDHIFNQKEMDCN